jgi:hypothetical protein
MSTPSDRDGPPCAASCGWPMDPRDYAAGFRYHPTCVPDEAIPEPGTDGASQPEVAQ